MVARNFREFQEVNAMHDRVLRLCSLLILVVTVGCAQPAPSRPTGAGQADQPATGASAGSGAAAGAATSNRTVRIVIRSEPGSIAGTLLIPSGITTTTERRIFNASLVLLDDASKPRPYLAEALPQLNSDSWRVLPDGRMEVTFKLKPNVTWHDGQPITAEDFIFAHEVYRNRAFGLANASPYVLIDQVTAPDPRTVVFHWSQAYPEAAEMNEQDFNPLPRHLLQATYERDAESLPNQTFWTSDYVGAGPYKVERWQQGAFLDAAAFDGHVLGRPKINRLHFTWSSDFNATLASLLAGEADIPADDSIRVEQGLTLEREWTARNAGTVQYRPALPRFIQVQHREQYANPQAVRDVRVRRALAHGIDKSVINETLFSGKGITSDSLIFPSVDYYAQVDRAIAKYPPDVRQTERLMTEAGYAKDSSGSWTGPGGSVNLEIRNIQSAQNDAERSIIADGWRRAGFQVEENVFTPVQTQQGETLGTFRSLSVTSAQPRHEGLNLRDFTSAAISRPDTRWFGMNRGGWSNADYDRAAETFASTLDPAGRQQAVIQAAKALSDDLGVIPLHFNPGVIAYSTGITGPSVKASDAELSWNIYEWTAN
jgi:peptide/nickel transport system substrate-binding protein